MTLLLYIAMIFLTSRDVRLQNGRYLKMKYDVAHEKAMDAVIDGGQNPIARIDGFLQFLENHYDGGVFDNASDYKDAIELIAKMRELNMKLDALESKEFKQTGWYLGESDRTFNIKLTHHSKGFDGSNLYERGETLMAKPLIADGEHMGWKIIGTPRGTGDQNGYVKQWHINKNHAKIV